MGTVVGSAGRIWFVAVHIRRGLRLFTTMAVDLCDRTDASGGARL